MIITKKSVSFAFILLLVAAWPCTVMAETSSGLTFEQARSLALQHNPAVQHAEASVDRKRGSTEATRAMGRLHADVISSYTALSETPEIDIPQQQAGSASLREDRTWATTLSLSKLIYSGGHVEALVRQADLSTDSSRWLVTRTAQRVAFSAEEKLLALLAAERQIEVAKQALQTAEAHHSVARARYEGGAAAEFDVFRAEVQVYEAQQRLTEAKSRLQIAHASLCETLGVTEGTFEASPSLVERQCSVPDRQDAQDRALELRPETRAVALQIESAQAGVEAASAEDSPTVHIGASYATATPESPMQFDHWQAGVTMKVPLLDGGYSRGRVTEARGRLTELEAEARDLSHQIRLEVATAVAQLESATARVETARGHVQQAEETQRLAEVRYSAGVATPTEVADAQTNLTRARQELIRALTDMQTAFSALQLATGTNLESN